MDKFKEKLKAFYKKTLVVLKKAYTFAKPYGIKVFEFLKKLIFNKAVGSITLAIVGGFGVGFIILLFVATDPQNAVDGLRQLLTGGFRNVQMMGNVLFKAAPLILVGLSVGFAFKTGLFNIGASGQFMVGGVAALYVANLVTAPAGIHFVLAIIAAIIAGSIWGFVPGILKAKFNVNEVITTIMMNYIAVYLTVMMVYNPAVYDQGITAINVNFPTASIPKLGLDKLFPGSNIDASILIATLTAVLIWFIIKKTTLGYQLTAVGLNRDSSKYAGINVKRNIVVSMMIAGALAGLAAAMSYLPMRPDYFRPAARINLIGFEGISIALIAQSNPLGIIFSGIFISFIKQGALTMQLFGFDKEITNIVTSVIIYMIAISGFIGSYFINRRIKRKILKEKEHSEKEDEA